jgi:hypothetical protein
MFNSMSSSLCCFNYLCTYDLYSPVHNVLDACISITRGSGRGLGLGIREFLGPVKWNRAERRVPFGPKKLEMSKAVYVPNCLLFHFYTERNIAKLFLKILDLTNLHIQYVIYDTYMS